MQLARPAFATHPKRFGRRPVRELAAGDFVAPSFGSDLKLFASTFAVGFLFVSVLLA
jgi:hypothetical protein